MEKESKSNSNFFDEFTFSEIGEEKIDNLYYEGSKFVPKKAFVASDDPEWWKDVEEKVHELSYHLDVGTMPYFAKALEDLSYITANHIDVDYELLGMFKIPDKGYYEDYLLTMEKAAQDQDPEGFINAFDGLVDYIDSMTPKEGSRKAQERAEEPEGYVDWDGIVSSVTELLALSRRKNLQYFMQELDYLNALVLDHVSLPDDLDPSEIV